MTIILLFAIIPGAIITITHPEKLYNLPWSSRLFQMLVLAQYPHLMLHCHNQAGPSQDFHCHDGSQCPSELTPHYLGRNKGWKLNFMHHTVNDKPKTFRSPLTLSGEFPCWRRLASVKISMTSVANSCALNLASFWRPCNINTTEGNSNLIKSAQ